MSMQTNIPNYADLFGNIDFKEGDDARTVYSPAAYLSDLLQMLDDEFDPSTVDFDARRGDIKDIDLDAEPEQGDEGEAAAARDAHADALKKAGIMDKEAADAAEALEEVSTKLEAYCTGDPDAIEQQRLDELQSALEEARQRAEKTTRRAAKARAKLENAAREAEAMGVVLGDP